MRHLSALLSQAAIAFAGVGLVAMTAMIFAQVVARYAFGQSLAWSEQAALVLMLWSVLPAAAAGVREGFHVRIALIAESGPPARQRALAVLTHALVGMFGLAMLVWGGELVVRTWSHDVPALPLPRGATYLPIPAAGLMIAFFAAEHLVGTVRKHR